MHKEMKGRKSSREGNALKKKPRQLPPRGCKNQKQQVILLHTPPSSKPSHGQWKGNFLNRLKKYVSVSQAVSQLTSIGNLKNRLQIAYAANHLVNAGVFVHLFDKRLVL